MASTNKTSNYELSQFLGTDKPGWLTDYNSDMSKIDTGIKNAADAATTAGGSATTAITNIGTLADLTTTAKTDLVSAVNEVNTTAGTADNTATQAATTASAAKTEADALTRYLSITNTGKITPTVTGGTIGNINDLYYALNADGTLGKIYGRLRITVNTTGSLTVTLPISGLTTASQFTISGGCYYNTLKSGDGFTVINARDLTVNTNGTVTISFSNFGVGESLTIWLPPCLYFFTDFGDVINPNT